MDQWLSPPSGRRRLVGSVVKSPETLGTVDNSPESLGTVVKSPPRGRETLGSVIKSRVRRHLEQWLRVRRHLEQWLRVRRLLDKCLNSFLTVTGKFSVMIGTVLYVYGSCEGHCKLKDRHAHPFETDTTGRLSSSLTFLETGQRTQTGRPK